MYLYISSMYFLGIIIIIIIIILAYCMACGILVPPPGIESMLTALENRVLTTVREILMYFLDILPTG